MMRSIAALIVCFVATIAVTAPVGAQQADSTYARLVREYTTDPRFLPASLESLPASGTVPSPRKYFGTIIGAPGVTHHADEVYGYFRALAKATPRVKVETIGKSEEGRDIILTIIADENTMRDLDRYKRLLARLADPRTLPDDSLDEVLNAAKPVYYLNGGLHSPEMGSPEMLMELAYRLAVSDDSAIAHIRDNVITIINPVSEPDGRDKQVDWYYRYTKGRPEFDDGFPRSTPYWGRYVVHDNNRDGIQMSQELTKAIYRVYYDWHPLIMHDLHESVPLLYISTGTGPYNVTNDPIAISEWQLLANNEITALSAAGLPGVWTWGFFDGWWPGYAVWVANNHNSIGRFYETFGNAGADTYIRDLSDERYAGEPVTSRQWYRSWPPTKKVRWSMRDNVNYQEAGVLTTLGYTADNAKTLLHNFWQKGYNSLHRARSEKPHAYVIPGFERQRDPRRAAYLVNQLERQHIEVHRRTAGDSAGDFVILLDQPYRDLAVNLLSIQKYPSTAQYPPYDDIAWTLGYLYGVDVKAVDDSSVFHWNGLELLRDTVAATASVRGSGSVYVMPYRAQAELLPALGWLRTGAKGARAWAAESAFTIGNDSFPAGSVILEGVSGAAASEIATRWALPLVAT
ncbi:MAG TPA: M14 family zinc carboxypeptidase, partial [Gemmatimonadaceae bacterium]|nr:M14 family zinc carboxypeptidase [Gemmatimonadaceae bacterium]